MRNDNKFIWAILFLSAVGFAVSIWLLSSHLKFSTGQAGLTEACSIVPLGDGKGCATIAVSEFSKPLGIPLASIAMGFYFSLFLLVFWSWRNPQSCYESLYFSFFMATLAIPVTVAMAYIAKYQLNSFCQGCATLWLINLLLWPALVKQLGLGWGNALSSLSEIFWPNKLRLQRSRIIRSALTGFITLAVFCFIGIASEAMQVKATTFGEQDKALKDFAEAPILFLNPDMFVGPHVKGAQNPIMDIVEFSDFQCPACKMAAQYFRPFLLKHPNEVRISYHHYPLDGACNPYAPNGQHQFGCASARAAICAGEQGKFFEFHDQIFDKQNLLTSDLISQIAKDLGINMETFAACVADPKTEARLQKDMEWGESVKVEFTPTIIINGRKMGGALAPAQLEQLLAYIRAQQANK
jgi:protein-disulfide isomerase/uncharacterized membrane protein